jgi:hypothetical protein
MPIPRALRHDRAHDYRHLIRRWRAAIRPTNLVLRKFAEASGYPIYSAEPKRPLRDRPWIYVSAGIHGDEPGATEGLLAWLERHPEQLDRWNFLLFPCLNPWGLVHNVRFDELGRDLNRSYRTDDIPQTAAHRAILAGRRFACALTLHEDYDANGAYVYEIKSTQSFWGEHLLRAATKHAPADHRKSIEGRSARSGLVRRSVDPGSVPDHPEAFCLHFHHADRTFTVETPSEFSIDLRADTHVAVLQRAIKLCAQETRIS